MFYIIQNLWPITPLAEDVLCSALENVADSRISQLQWFAWIIYFVCVCILGGHNISTTPKNTHKYHTQILLDDEKFKIFTRNYH